MKKTNVFKRIIVMMMVLSLLVTTMGQTVMATSSQNKMDKQAIQLAKEVYQKLSPEAKKVFEKEMEKDSQLLDFHKKNVNKKYVKTSSDVSVRSMAMAATANPLTVLSTELVKLNLPTAVRYTLMAMGGGLVAAGIDGPLPIGDIVAAVIAVGGAAILAYYWDAVSPKWGGIVNAFKKAFSNMASNIQSAFNDIALKVEILYVSAKIPSKLKKSNGNVDLSKFSGKGPLFPRGGKSILGPLGYQILKDLDGHKGSVWKLLNKAGERIASLAADGRIVGK